MDCMSDWTYLDVLHTWDNVSWSLYYVHVPYKILFPGPNVSTTFNQSVHMLALSTSPSAPYLCWSVSSKPNGNLGLRSKIVNQLVRLQYSIPPHISILCLFSLHTFPLEVIIYVFNGYTLWDFVKDPKCVHQIGHQLETKELVVICDIMHTIL